MHSIKSDLCHSIISEMCAWAEDKNISITASYILGKENYDPLLMAKYLRINKHLFLHSNFQAERD